MLNLPQSTEVKRQLPKAQLYKQFGWSASQREAFDAVVSRIDFVNWIAPNTLPSIAEGNEVKAIAVVEVTLKSRDFDIKPIAMLAKAIPQRIIYILRYGEEMKLAVWHEKLFVSGWHNLNSQFSILNSASLTLDAVWQTIVTSIGQFSVEEDNSLTDQIRVNEERSKLLRQIEVLERKMRSAAQPRRKREIFQLIQNLKGQLI